MPPLETAGRVLVAFDDDSLTWAPTWTALDQEYPSLISSFTIDRGRQYELDRVDTGRAVVTIADSEGILDPTNPGGPFYGKLEPLLQIALGRHDPIADEWHTRFRGFIEQFDYAFDPSQRVNRLTIQCVDIFDILAAIEMWPRRDGPTGQVLGTFGNKPPASVGTGDVVFFEYKHVVRDRMEQVLGNAGIPDDWVVLFSGNVELFATTYSPGENVLTVLTECADGEFPGVGNVYTDRFGRFVFHGRLARFTPEDIAGDAGPDRWDWHQWDVGDHTAVLSNPDCSQIREFAFDRGLSKIINHASATPLYANTKAGTSASELTPSQVANQLVTDDVSIGLRGFRSWSAQNLLTAKTDHPGDTGGDTSLKETKRFATYYVDNYADPHNRITVCGFRAMPLTSDGAEKTWQLLSQIDISDEVFVFVDSPGGGGFNGDGWYVEGIHEEQRPLGVDDYDDVTLRLDLSPVALYDTNPWG